MKRILILVLISTILFTGCVVKKSGAASTGEIVTSELTSETPEIINVLSSEKEEDKKEITKETINKIKNEKQKQVTEEKPKETTDEKIDKILRQLDVSAEIITPECQYKLKKDSYNNWLKHYNKNKIDEEIIKKNSFVYIDACYGKSKEGYILIEEYKCYTCCAEGSANIAGYKFRVCNCSGADDQEICVIKNDKRYDLKKEYEKGNISKEGVSQLWNSCNGKLMT